MRHNEYKFVVEKVDKRSQWIYINDPQAHSWGDGLYCWEDDGPIEFLRRIIDVTGWKLVEHASGRYSFLEDPLMLEYWWDDLFGFTVGLKSWSRLDDALMFLSQFTIR